MNEDIDKIITDAEDSPTDNFYQFVRVVEEEMRARKLNTFVGFAFFEDGEYHAYFKGHAFTAIGGMSVLSKSLSSEMERNI